MELRRNRDRECLLKLHEQLINEAKSYCKQHPLTFSAEQIKTYSTIGGTPFLDNQYTVFGEVVEGLDVVERIQQAPLELMETIFHPDEIRYVEQGDATTRPQRFFEIWTKKEAYTKCMGTGLITELTKLNTFDASIFPHLYAWQVDDYMCAVCCYH